MTQMKDTTMQAASHSWPVTHGNTDDADYEAFLKRVNLRFIATTEGKPVFLTTAQPHLWDYYLRAFPIELRQHHNCNACRQFVERFGSLVVVNEDGTLRSALWDVLDAHEPYKASVAAMREMVLNSRITGVFVSNEKVWGLPKTGNWQHLFVNNPAVYRGMDTPYQRMAEKLQDYLNVERALREYTPATLGTAIELLESEALYRAEKVIGPAKFLLKLHIDQGRADGSLPSVRHKRANILWLAVANAPAGFCHPRSSMIGSLLDDIVARKTFGDVKRAFDKKMQPLAYQRPQAAPAAGNIAAAERAFAAMGLERSLERRYARLDEIEAVWRPLPQARAEGLGLFGHLAPKGEQPIASMTISGQIMTYEKFVRLVLPAAHKIELLVPHSGLFVGLVSAVHADAPPIIQWDREERRNPVSWYVYPAGSPAARWNLAPGRFAQVNAVTLKPSMWHDGSEHQGKGVIFVLDGARDQGNPSACLFPEILRSELHPYRATIEAYSRSATLAGRAEGNANGYMLTDTRTKTPLTLRVTTAAGVRDVAIDRWD